MKLPIKKKYFDLIKSGKKMVEFRDAHITFVCEETKEELRRDLMSVEIIRKGSIPESYYKEGLLEDDKILAFAFEPKYLLSSNVKGAKE